MLARALERHPRKARNRSSVQVAHEHVLFVTRERLSHSRRDSSRLGSGLREKTGALAWCVGRARSRSISLDLLRAWPSDLNPGRHVDGGLRRHLLDAVSMLSAEPEPKPGVDERVVGGGNDHVMPGPALFDPDFGDGGIEIAHIFRLFDGVAGGTDPDVRAPESSSRSAPSR